MICCQVCYRPGRDYITGGRQRIRLYLEVPNESENPTYPGVTSWLVHNKKVSQAYSG